MPKTLARKKEIEKHKGKLVLEHRKQWRTARDLFSFLDEFQTEAQDTPGLDEYIAWAREYAQAINPISRLEHIIFDDQKLEDEAPRSYRWRLYIS